MDQIKQLLKNMSIEEKIALEGKTFPSKSKKKVSKSKDFKAGTDFSALLDFIVVTVETDDIETPEELLCTIKHKYTIIIQKYEQANS